MTPAFKASCRRAYWAGVPVFRIAVAMNASVSRVERALFVRVRA